MSDDEDEVYNSDEYNSDEYDFQQARRAELEDEEERHDRRLYFRNQAALQNYDNNQRFLERVQLANHHFLVHKSKLDSYLSKRLSVPNMNIFVHQSARDGKAYLHGSYKRMFDFLHASSRNPFHISPSPHQ